MPPSFVGPTPFAVGTNPISVAVGYFNADGHPDLAVANPNSVSILLGDTNGDGGFTGPTDLAVGPSGIPTSVAVGDFDGDGKSDLAVAVDHEDTDEPGTATILFGNGDGTFKPNPMSFPAANEDPLSVAVGDFDGDGKSDLAITGVPFATTDPGAVVLLGNGNGTFKDWKGYANGVFADQVAVGDFNSDDKPDLAVADDFNDVLILVGNGLGGFTGPTFPEGAGVSGSFRSVAVGDFDGGGHPDLALADHGLFAGDVGGVLILLGTGSGFASADFPCLELPDTHCGPGSGGFGEPKSFLADAKPSSVAVGDFNSDGHPDLAVANSDSNNVSILSGDGNGGFTPPTNFSADTNPNSVAIGDFNGDLRPDIAVANEGSDNVSVLLNDTPGPPIVETTACSQSAIGATLTGRVNPHFADTTYYFDYGTSTAYGSRTQQQFLGAGRDFQSVSAPLSGLEPGNTYHYRLVATNSVDTRRGSDQTCITSPLGASGVDVSAHAGDQLGQPPLGVLVANFQDADHSATSTDYGATVTWGDGSTSSGLIVPQLESLLLPLPKPGAFSARANHTYGAPGNYPIATTITKTGGVGAGETVTATSTAHIGPVCIRQVRASPVVVAHVAPLFDGGECFQKQGPTTYSTTNALLVNGLTVKSPGGTVTVDTAGHLVAISKPGAVQIENIKLRGLPAGGSFSVSKPDVKFNPVGDLHGFPFKGSIEGSFDPDESTTLTGDVSIYIGALGIKVGANLGAGVVLYTSNQRLGVLDRTGFHVHVASTPVEQIRTNGKKRKFYRAGDFCNPGGPPDAPKNPSGWLSRGWECRADPTGGHLIRIGNSEFNISWLPIEELDVQYQSDGGEWKGHVVIALNKLFPVKLQGSSASAKLAADFSTQPTFKLHSLDAELDDLNFPVGEAILLQDLGLNFGLDPFKLGGHVRATAGPEKTVETNGSFTYLNGKSSGFDFDVRGDVNLFHELKLGAAELEYDGRDGGSKVTLTGTIGGHFGPNGIVELSANVNGGFMFSPAFHFQLGGGASAKLFGHGIDGQLLVSDAGLGMCGGHIPVVNVALGFHHRWDESDWHPLDCDLSGLYTVSSAGASATAVGGAIHLPGHLKGEEFAAVGANTPPAVVLSGPNGFRVESPTSLDQPDLRPGVFAYSERSSRTTYFFVDHPRGGLWRLAPKPGTPAPVRYLRADPLRSARIRARVAGHGRHRTLRWHFPSQQGESVTFIETGPASADTIISRASRSGTRRFGPARGPRGRRAILALVTIDGLPRKRVVVAHYAAPGTPVGRARHASYRLSRAGIAIKWGRAARATAYDIDVSLSDHSHMRMRVGRRARHVRTILPPCTQVRRVAVTAVDGPFSGRPTAATRLKTRHPHRRHHHQVDNPLAGPCAS